MRDKEILHLLFIVLHMHHKPLKIRLPSLYGCSGAFLYIKAAVWRNPSQASVAPSCSAHLLRHFRDDLKLRILKQESSPVGVSATWQSAAVGVQHVV